MTNDGQREVAQALKVWKTAKTLAFAKHLPKRNETVRERIDRRTRLEKNFEEWAKYYFAEYYRCEPAPFHVASSERVLKNSEFIEVRKWSRDLAKSARIMMETLYLTLTKRKRTVLLCSETEKNAVRLLSPIKTELETNIAIRDDYGVQPQHGAWEESEFVTLAGVGFRALGKGQSPRGHRVGAYRPDMIIIDDIDGDEEVLNPERLKKGIDWVERALLGTRSTGSEQGLLVVACGNIIAQECTMSFLSDRADYEETINIVDAYGKSVWPQKISQAMIKRLRATLSHRAFEAEYMNNAMAEGYTFKVLRSDACPPIKDCEVVVYADPAPSDAEVKGGSHKAIAVVGKKEDNYYLFKMWVDIMSNAKFVRYLYDAKKYCEKNNVDSPRFMIENNSLQKPFYDQVLKPTIDAYGKTNETGYLSLSQDTRKKGNKFSRIEATLEPLVSGAKFIFNKTEKANPHMMRCKEQFLTVAPKAKIMDAPDAVEGAVWILKRNALSFTGTIYSEMADRSF